MKITVHAPGAAPRRWHQTLADRLRANGHEVWVCAVGGAPDDDLPASLGTLVWFERAVFGRALAAFQATPPRDEPQVVDGCDLLIDLTGGPPRPAAVPVLRPCFDGVDGWSALYQALLGERSPVMEVRRNPTGRVAARGVAALPQPALFSSSLDAALARLSVLIASAVSRTDTPDAAAGRARPAPPPHPALFGARHFARGVERKLRALVEHPIHWRIGWRALGEGPDLFDRPAWPADGYRWLEAGADRYVADPFVLVRDGVTHVFCEVLLHSDGRGRIGVFTLDAAGTPGPLRIVLERPYHLSYPLVFERDGQVWMIPETYENRSVELYRAERFPDVWVKEGDIFTDVELSDVTFAEHEGRFWMFAADTAGGATTWDTLALFMADDWKGPWRPHPTHPVLVDAQSARPAGLLQRRGATLLRPAQDCRAGYGAGLTICRVDRLDPEGYAQTTLATLGPIGRRDTGAHTVNVGGGFELIDHCGPLRRW